MNIGRWNNVLLLVVIALSAGCCSTVPRNTVTQISTIDALLASVYDGQMSCGNLLKYGDFGIGTFDKLDGEMIVLAKPQFEVGRGAVGTGGIVRDPALRRAAAQKVAEALSAVGFQRIETMESPLPGAEGNVEYLLHAAGRSLSA